jgi:hypothetical protein
MVGSSATLIQGSQLKDADLLKHHILQIKNPVATEAAAGPEQRREPDFTLPDWGNARNFSPQSPAQANCLSRAYSFYKNPEV